MFTGVPARPPIPANRPQRRRLPAPRRPPAVHRRTRTTPRRTQRHPQSAVAQKLQTSFRPHAGLFATNAVLVDVAEGQGRSWQSREYRCDGARRQRFCSPGDDEVARESACETKRQC